MRLTKSMQRYVAHIDRSGTWVRCLGAAGWVAGAGLSAVWMVHGGGAVRPLASFAVWATGVFFVTIRGLDGTTDFAPTLSEAVRALRYGVYSAAALALGTLFCEYWPVTVSMVFMFAVCRSFEQSDDTAACV